MLTAKAAALALIYLAFFGPPHRIDATAARTAQMILGSASAPSHAIGNK